MNSGGKGGSRVAFEATESTLSVHDELEGVTQRIEADSPVEPQPALTELFHVPVDDAVSFDAAAFTVVPCGGALLRDEAGDVVTQPTAEPYTAARGTYYLEIVSPIKVYVRLPDVEVTVAYADEPFEDPVRVTLGGERTVTVGARSQHSRPEATITVPDDPAARMAAFSYLGSSIKEFTPERSWPTLRGYPPRIERGDALDVPSALTKPDTGITVTVPPTHADVYRVAPLAFYFGATVEPGEHATLRLPNGYAEPLVTPERTLEESVERIVAKCFLLDTLARQEGYTPITVRCYGEVGPHLPFYPEALADDPLADQLLEYLEAPDDPVLDALPHWPVAAVLRPDPADVTLVPHLLESTAFVSVAADASDRPPATVREGASSPIAVGYSHEEVPAGGVALEAAAYERDLAGTAVVETEATVAYLTDDRDRAERLASHLDSAPVADIPARFDVHASPTTADLQSVLSAEADLVVLDLPVSAASGAGGDAAGPVVDCADGPLDLSTLQSVRPRTVVVDGERAPATSPRAFVDGSRVAGAEPVSDAGGAETAGDDGAVVALVAAGVAEPNVALSVVGCLLGAWSVAGTARLHFAAEDYRLAGVADATAADRNDGRQAMAYIVERLGPDRFSVSYVGSPMGVSGVGGVIQNVESFSHDEYHLLGSASRMPATVSADQVRNMLADEDVVVILDGDVYANVLPPASDAARRAARPSSGDSSASDLEPDEGLDRPGDWIPE